MNVPDHLHYTAEHEWVELLGESRIRVGITDYAQDALGDVVFIHLTEMGSRLEGHARLAEVESTKSVAEVYSPLAGSVAAVNGELNAHPELVNQDPYGRGWFVEMDVDDPAAIDGLLDATAYRKLTE
ncbi:MAG: glycine cleavage system protein GcvH [Acidimicrobiia bacterium]